MPTLNNLTMTGTTLDFTASGGPSLVDMVSDAIGSGNIISLGGATTLTVQVDSPTATQYFGAINGVGAGLDVTTASSGELDLNGSNTYSNGTTVNANVLLVAGNNSALGTGSVTLNAGAALGVAPAVTISNQLTVNDGSVVAGYGTVAPASPETLTFQNGSTVIGGRGTLGSAAGLSVPGALTFSNNASLVFGGGGRHAVLDHERRGGGRGRLQRDQRAQQQPEHHGDGDHPFHDSACLGQPRDGPGGSSRTSTMPRPIRGR